MRKSTCVAPARKEQIIELCRAVKDAWSALSVRGPVYAASVGLLLVYAWGYLSTFPTIFALGAIGVAGMGELLKPRLLELVEDALRCGARAKGLALIVAAASCVAISVAGGVVALNAAEAPARGCALAQHQFDALVAERASVDRAIAGLPVVGASMPAARITAFTAWRNAEIARLEASKPPAPRAVPIPGVVLPEIGIWTKLAVVGAIEFVIFVVPWGSRLNAGHADRAFAEPLAGNVIKRPRDAPAAPNTPPPNDGGWITRRAKYGPGGRRQPLRIVGGQALKD